MKRHLFYTFLWIFGVTSLVTLLGVTGVIKIADGFLWALVSAFLIESAGAVVAVFNRADFFSDDAPRHEVVASIQKPQTAEVPQPPVELADAPTKILVFTSERAPITKEEILTQFPEGRRDVAYLIEHGFIGISSFNLAGTGIPPKYDVDKKGRDYLSRKGLA